MKTLDDTRIPRYLRLAHELRNDIERGTLKPGDRLPSFADVKSRHGLSQDTWQKVHAVLAEEKLIVRAPGRGTFVAEPDARVTRHGVVGVSGYGFGFSGCSSYWAQLLGGMREAAQNAGHQVLLLDIDSSKGWEKADGVILCDWSAHDTMRHLPPSCPSVSLMVPIEGMSSVYADEHEGMRAVTQHLISLGHQRIAYLHGIDKRVNEVRIAGYKAALQEAKIRPSARWVRSLPGGLDYGNDFVDMGRAAMTGWLNSNWDSLRCTAVLAHNDETAIGVIEALRSSGRQVPREVSVAGFDGLDIGVYFTPRLTTVRLPLHEIGVRAIEKLLKQIEGGSSDMDCALPAALDVHASTAAIS